MKNVPNLGEDITDQSMRYQDSIDKMEPLCNHCRKKLTNQILPFITSDGKRFFEFGGSLYQVEKLT
jgi:hypothetical protein